MITCAPDVKNLYIELVRNRTKTLYLAFGNWQSNTVFVIFPENPLPRVDYFPPSWIPTDITNWRFTFSMNQYSSTQMPPNFGLALKYDPLVNISDPTTGILAWNIQSGDTAAMIPGNYFFEMTVISDGINPRFLCSGAAALIDNLNDSVTFPPPSIEPLGVVIICNSVVVLGYHKQ